MFGLQSKLQLIGWKKEANELDFTGRDMFFDNLYTASCQHTARTTVKRIIRWHVHTIILITCQSYMLVKNHYSKQLSNRDKHFSQTLKSEPDQSKSGPVSRNEKNSNLSFQSSLKTKIILTCNEYSFLTTQ
jgi:hypothetical protein